MARDVHGLVRAQRAGEDAHHRDAADVGVGGGLDDLGHEWPVGVARDRGARTTGGGEDLGQRVLERRGETGDDQVEQLHRAGAGGRVDGDHRVERPPRHGPLQVAHQRVAVDLLPGEVAVHEPLVLGLLDHRLDEVAALGVVGVVVGQQADQAPALEEVGRHDLVAERLARLRDDAVVVGPRVVELGDHHRPRHAHGGALAPQLPGRLVDAVVGGDHEHRRVRGAQARPQLAHEVGVAGGVEQVDLDTLVLERGEGERDRPLLSLLGLVEVGDRGAVDGRARPGQHTGRDQEGLGQRRLARSGGSDQDHVADLPGGPGDRDALVAGRPTTSAPAVAAVGPGCSDRHGCLLARRGPAGHSTPDSPAAQGTRPLEQPRAEGRGRAAHGESRTPVS